MYRSDAAAVSTPTALWITALAVVSVAVTAPLTAADQPSGWQVDANHTEINFSIKHFFTPVTGSFRDFEVDLDYDAESPENSSVAVEIQVASIDTGNERRDNHLRSADWFDAEAHPLMTFKSTSVRRKGKNKLVVRGPLTIKGKAQEIELPVTLLGTQEIPKEMQEMLGGTQEVASFHGSTAIDRGDYEVGVGNWAATLVVGGEVTIEIQVEAHRK